MGTTWTIALWLREVFGGQVSPFSVVSSTQATSHLFRIQIKSALLKMLDGFFQDDISIPLDWAQGQWVCIYIFSDNSSLKRGYGAYVPLVGTEYFESSTSGAFDMTTYQASYQIRIGSKNNDQEPTSNIRKLVIIKGNAIHSTSTNTIDDLLNSIDCPRLIATSIPACQGTYFYYKMTSGFVTNSHQTVVDSSGNSVDATNGSSTTVDSKDCSAQVSNENRSADSVYFNGACFLQRNGLSLSSRGFSIEVDVIVASSASQMSIIKETFDQKFDVSIDPANSRVILEIDAENGIATGCTGLQSGTWVTIGVSIIADDSEHQYMIYCNHSLLKQGGSSKKLNFSLSKFKIGDGFRGSMKEFKLYYLALGKETLTHSTIIPSSCSSGFYFDSGTSQCEACPSLCTACSSGTSGSCSTCVANASTNSGVCECNTNSYLNGVSCHPCDSLCATCTGSGSSLCLSCASGKYQVDGTSTCVSACTDYAPDYFLDGSVCKQCNSFCATCSGPFQYNCDSCASGATELVSSPLKNPVHCDQPCPAGQYSDGQNCLGTFQLTLACATNCEICSGLSPQQCSLCLSDFFLLPSSSECITSCPSGFFSNSALRTCESCSDSNCLDCSSDKNICLSCSTLSSYYLDGVTCSFCAPPNETGPDFCSACTLEGYSISDTGECEEQCGDGQLLSPFHQCDDGNTTDGDGCSSACLIESGYLCERISSSSPDVCQQIRQLGISSISIDQESLKIQVSFSETVLFQNLTLAQFTFNYTNISPQDVTISLVQPSTCLQSSFTLQITPHSDIPQDAALSFIINSVEALSSPEQYIQVPQQIESSLLDLPSYELVLSSFDQSAQPVGQAMTWSSILLLIGMSVSQLVMQSSMESMWVLVCVNQLISYIPLMSITFPSNLLVLFNILTFFNGEVYILLLAYDYSVGLFFNFPGEPQPYNERFALLEYDSVKLMDNSGVFITIWIFHIIFVLILLVSLKVCKCPCCIRSSTRLLRCVIWGPILRTFIVTFLELGFCAFINIIYISFESLPDTVSSVISLIVLFTLLMLPFVLLHILSATPSTLQDTKYKQKFGQVYKDLDYSDNYMASFYYPIFLLHRYFFIGIVFGAYFSGLLQCCLMIVATLLFLWFLIKWKPFSLKLDIFLNILAALILAILYCFCLVFTFLDQSYKSERQIIGYVFIALVLGLFIFTSILVLISKIRQCINRKSRKKLKPEILPTDTGFNINSQSPTFLPRMSMFRSRIKPAPSTNLFSQNYQEEPTFLEEFRIKPLRRKSQHPEIF